MPPSINPPLRVSSPARSSISTKFDGPEAAGSQEWLGHPAYAEASRTLCTGGRRQMPRPVKKAYIFRTKAIPNMEIRHKMCKGGAEVAPGQGDAMEQGNHRKREREQVQQP